MSWNRKVFDNLEQIYWSPGKIGLNKVHGTPTTDGEGYIVPASMLDGGRSLYSRRSTFADWRKDIIRNEEILNHVLEIGLAIAPSQFLEQAFFKPLDIRPEGRIQTIGRESLQRHAAYAPRQFTQHDGFYLSANSMVMMEMKLKARTSVEQYLKYCSLIALEEMLSGKKAALGLVYLVPARSVASTRRILRLDDPAGLSEIWAAPDAFTDKSTLGHLLRTYTSAIQDVGQRLRVAVLTWDYFLKTLVAARNVALSRGEETLANLMQGMIAQISATPDCQLVEMPDSQSVPI